MEGLTRGPELTYPVLLVHDLLFPFDQARCRASALLLCLGLEGGLGIGVIALTWDMKEVISGSRDLAALKPYAALQNGVGHRGEGAGHPGRGREAAH